MQAQREMLTTEDGRSYISRLSDKDRADYYYAKLCTIANIELDDDECEETHEMTGEKEYVYLSPKETQENLERAVGIARDAVMSWVKL